MSVPVSGGDDLFSVSTDGGPTSTCKVCGAQFTPGVNFRTICSSACRDRLRGTYLPSAAEIAAECERFQARWDDTEKLRRRGINPARAYVEVTTARAEDLGLDDLWET